MEYSNIDRMLGHTDRANIELTCYRIGNCYDSTMQAFRVGLSVGANEGTFARENFPLYIYSLHTIAAYT